MSNTEPHAPHAWNVSLAKSAQKQLDKLPTGDFKRVDAAIEGMRVDPFTGDVVHLKNAEATFRRRVGDYRILFDVLRERRHVDVLAILRRTTTTYRKRRR
ncbi:MAG: type II toxin-antitoxin system RelE/ParE family toxin [Deltaproteobacteria bacterium]|nr:type II toxin-antitoxin system RelE/ParE family toxin [Deltaproteobacteria bacterium]